MSEYLLLVVSAILVNNILLAQFLGNCPFLGVSQKMGTATGMGMAVIFVLTLAGAITWIVQWYLLVPYELEYLRTIAFILVIAALVQLVEIVLQKTAPALYNSLGIFLPLITTNCAVLGVAIINIQKDFDFINTLIYSFASAVGFALALVLFAGLRERFALTRMPKALQGTASGLITAGLMALAFQGFKGLI
ncbi:MAG: electron transport complex subunit RsxA [Candidatus Eisenbacteria bacterium]|uniref:Ion-translocating oxidoreductase complex subunit A n=1 Tax=Eiseniibacteriota bacterium TaxID=2212470 RepID=A0A948RWU4_UNCEI|nr:electron transport complex subunit RsxA [Candidatus Eisenbacteria bacterium]MBU1951263.1 electron transport complex subunit RsxA [Candidatus Eisenbacteria bacterium]MBU2691007.1 electron transport complex subunit RsxA [Candidatus Eisenbacteria bacterium]